jgi:hypothetical protein
VAVGRDGTCAEVEGGCWTHRAGHRSSSS